MQKSELGNCGISLCADMDKLGHDNRSYFPSWEELLPLMEGSLSLEQQVNLLERIRTSETNDPSKKALKGILERNSYDVSELQRSNKRLRKKLAPKNSYTRIPVPLRRLAATIILFIGITSLILFLSGKSEFSEAYSHDPGFLVFMSGEDHANNWMERYRAGEFQSALEKINNRKDFNSNDTLKYYAAVIYYEQALFERSLNLLNTLEDTSLLHKAYLLKSFNYYRLNRVDSAKAQLEYLSQFERHEGRKAKSYLKRYFQ